LSCFPSRTEQTVLFFRCNVHFRGFLCTNADKAHLFCCHSIMCEYSSDF
jgi:hypothetical protein